MTDEWTETSIADALPALLAGQGLSLRSLARDVGVDPSFLRKALAGHDHQGIAKRLPAPTIAAITERLGLPAGYFPEEREAAVVERAQADPTYRDRAYALLVDR